MSDFEQIQRTLNAYARNVDDRTPERFGAEVFSQDADVEVGFGQLNGIDQIVREYAAEIGNFSATIHANTNLEVDIDGDTARSTLYVSFYCWPKGAVSDAQGQAESPGGYFGVYIDTLVRQPEGWRISHRRFRKFGPPQQH